MILSEVSDFFLRKKLHVISVQSSTTKSQWFLPPKLLVLGELMSMEILSPGVLDLLLTPFFIFVCLAFAIPQSSHGAKVPVNVKPMCLPVALVISSPG